MKNDKAMTCLVT